MKKHNKEHSISSLAKVLKVSPAGYYRWKSRSVSNQYRRRQKVKTAVEQIYFQYKKCYGAPRITKELNAIGMRCSKNFIATILRDTGLKARNGKNFKYRPAIEARTNVADNVLRRDFKASYPNQKWTTDITYIWVNGRWLYLAVVMDLYSRAIVGWSLARHMTEELVCDALDMAFDNREVKDGLIVHSDRGVQYRSNRYRRKLLKHVCRISMSRAGNCWDNAAMESFFSRFKVELIHAEKFETIAQARSAIFEYIEIFYNRKRRHSAIGYISPMQFEKSCA
jgi:putative transposase